MTSFTSQILPTLDAFGVWSYWIIGFSSLLEGWWLTSIIVPGTLIVDAGGALARLGHLDVIDLGWFVALGAILGGEISWHTGKWLGNRVALPTNGAFLRAQDLTRRRGGLALVIGRFFGPVAGFVPLAAAFAGMNRRHFVLWNVASGFIYAAGHVAVGYLAGDIMARLGPYLPRLILPLVLLALLVAVTWFVVQQLKLGLPALRAGASALRKRLLLWPVVQHFLAQNPRLEAIVVARLHPERGLLMTAIFVLVIYLIGVFIDGALDLVFVPETAALDQRISNLAHAYWSPFGLKLAASVTQLGHVPVATLVGIGAVAVFALWGRRATAIGLATAIVGNAMTVTLLKLAFGRERPTLGYFLETSHSFPSGHAAISVALYGTLAAMLWREKVVGPTTAVSASVALAASIGFTRIYLVEHYLSDVLNGWVVGAIWMTIGFGVAQAMQKIVSSHPPRAILATLTFAAAAISAGWFAINDVKSPQIHNSEAPVVFESILSRDDKSSLPLSVTDLTGEALPAISVIVVGADVATVRAVLGNHGWEAVPEPNLWSISSAIWSDVIDNHSTSSTVPPAFYEGQPASVTLFNTDSATLLRIWHAGITGNGKQVLAMSLEESENNALADLTKTVAKLENSLTAAAVQVRSLN